MTAVAVELLTRPPGATSAASIRTELLPMSTEA